jgi:ketosteroid isomerase-like protein
MEQHSIEIVRGVYEAFGRGDLQAVLGAMADEFDGYEAEACPTTALPRLGGDDRERVGPTH